MAVFSADELSLLPDIQGYSESLSGMQQYLRDVEDFFEREGSLYPSEVRDFANLKGNYDELHLGSSDASLTYLNSTEAVVSSEGLGHILVVGEASEKITISSGQSTSMFVSTSLDDPLSIDVVSGALEIIFLDDSVGVVNDIGIDPEGFLEVNGASSAIQISNYGTGGLIVGSAFSDSTAQIGNVEIDPGHIETNSEFSVLSLDDAGFFFDEDIDVPDDLSGILGVTAQSVNQSIAPAVFANSSDLFVLEIDETILNADSVPSLVEVDNNVSQELISIDSIIDIGDIYTFGLQDELTEIL